MKTTLLIYQTEKKAKKRFNELVTILGNEIWRCSETRMEIDIGATTYKFLVQDEKEKCFGLMFDRVIVDEQLCILSEEMNEWLRTRTSRKEIKE